MIFLMQGWADFVDWLGGGPAAQALAASVTLIVTVALAVFTFLYAKSAGRQAKASVRMAEEMEQQRLDADRPYLLITVQGLEQIEWEEVAVAEGAEPEPEAAYPQAITCRINNYGHGPAKEVVGTVFQPLVQFEQKRKDVIAPGESWRMRIGAARLAGVIHEGLTGEPPIGLKDWMKSRGIESSYEGVGYDCGVVVFCTDIHDRPWATYLRFGLITHTDAVRNVVTERVLVPVEQRIVQLGEAT